MRYLIIIMLLTSGCGVLVDKSQRIDEELLPYVQDFTELTGMNVDHSVVFTDLNTEKLIKERGGTYINGLCTIWGPSGMQQLTVLIDEHSWATMNEDGREQLMIHELAHCSGARLKHDDALLSNGCPTSIMYPYSFGSGACYSMLKTYYYKQIQEAL